MHNFIKRIAPLMLTLAVLLNVPMAGAQNENDWKTTEEHWYAMEMFGAPAGWMNRITQTQGDQVRTINETSMKFNRGSIAVEIAMSTVFTEAANGKPIMVQSSQKMATQEMKTRWDFIDDAIKITTTQGGNDRTTQQPQPTEAWLMPAAADRFSKIQRKAGVETFTYRTMNPEAGVKLVTITATKKGEAKFTRNGEETDVVVWSVKNDVVPMDMLEHVDSDGNMVYQETNMQGMGKMILRLTTREQATGVAAAAAIPEVLFQTFVAPDRPIENPDKSVRSMLKLTVKEGRMGELPSAGAQRVEAHPEGKMAVLRIDINNPLPATAEEIGNKDFLAASAMIDSENELIQKLTNSALREVESKAPMDRAEALRKFVRSHISNKGMGTAFASASETATMRTGDCSEHGVLLAAMLRAAGIPARVAIGLIYADAFAGHEGIFGWHMWTQALIGGKWVDLDATTRERFNATHILISASSLNDGALAGDFAAAIQLIGNLNIVVVSVDYE